jgi:hypothetical protein
MTRRQQARYADTGSIRADRHAAMEPVMPAPFLFEDVSFARSGPGSPLDDARFARVAATHFRRDSRNVSLMLNFIFLIGAGLFGASVGWLAGAYLATQTSIEQAVSSVPLIGQFIVEIGLREICAGFGLVIGIILASKLGRGRTSSRATSRGILATIVTGGILYGVSDAGGALFDSIGVNPLAPAFEFEIRLPAGSKIPMPREDIQIELHTDRNQIVVGLNEIANEGDRPVLHGTAPLKFRTAQRQIVMSLPSEPVRVFLIRLPARPVPAANFGPWQQVDFIEEASRKSRRADVTADYAIRYRVK